MRESVFGTNSEEEVSVSAREKLNSGNLIGTIFPAAVLGWIAHSWTVFVFVATAIVGIATFSSGIRPPPARRRRA